MGDRGYVGQLNDGSHWSSLRVLCASNKHFRLQLVDLQVILVKPFFLCR